MYAITKDYMFYPKPENYEDALNEAWLYAKTICNGKDFDVTKVYGWCWCITVYINTQNKFLKI